MKRAIMRTATLYGLLAAALCARGTMVLDCDTSQRALGIGTNARIPPTCTAYTIEAWIKPTATSTSELRFFGQFSGESGRTLMAYTGGKVGAFNGGGNGWTTGATVLQANTWYHVAAVFDSSAANKTVIYVNGVQDGVNTKDLVAIASRCISLGSATASQVSSDTNRDYETFKGRLADVRVWKVARTQSEIEANRHSRLAGNETGLLAYWPLDATGDDGRTVTEVVTGWRSLIPEEHFTFVEDADLSLTSVERLAVGRQTTSATWAKAARGLETDIKTSLGTSFTLETWVMPKADNADTERWILDQFNVSAGRFIFATYNNKPSFFVGGYTSGHVMAPDPLPVGQWTHLALTRDGYDFSIYTNGYVAVEQTVNNAPAPPDVAFCIGSSSWKDANGNPRGVPFWGAQREVRVWNFCKTGEQIRETMGRTLFGNEAGLRGYWPLDEGNGSNLLNRVTGVSCVNVVAEPVWETTKAPPVEHTPGPNSQAAPDFMGSIHTGIDTGTKVTTTNYTLEAWVRVRSEYNGDAYIASQFSPGTQGANMFLSISGSRLTHLQDGHAETRLVGASVLPRNHWMHVAYVQDGTCRRLYVDGVLDAEIDDGVACLPVASQDLKIGYVTHKSSHWRCYSLDGSLADVRFWNCARTAKEIAKFRTHRLSGKEPGLVGYWPLDDGANGTVANLAKGGTPGSAFVVWDSLDDLVFGEPLKLGFSIIVR